MNQAAVTRLLAETELLGVVRSAAPYDVAALERRVTDPQDIAPVLREAFASGKPNLIDMRVADGFDT